MLFFEEGAASFFETAVDHILGFDLITERERTLVSVFYVDDVELREDLLESARRMGGDEVPTARHDDPVFYGILLTSMQRVAFRSANHSRHLRYRNDNLRKMAVPSGRAFTPRRGEAQGETHP